MNWNFQRIAIFHLWPKALPLLNPFSTEMHWIAIWVFSFQSMKSPDEQNSLFVKFFCYITCFDKTRHWMPCKRGFYVKSYVFFETITYLFKNCKLISNGNISRTKTNLLSELRFSKNWQECYFYSNWRFASCNCIKNNIPT